jgi:hypothetical protein
MNNSNKLISFKTNNKPGILHCLNELDFNTKRLFYIDNFYQLNEFKNNYLDIDKSLINNKRGLHANINFDELLVVIEGQIKIKLIEKNQNEYKYTLDKNDYIFIPKMNWIEFEIIRENTIILVLANEILSKSKSVHNFNEFINL